METPSTIVYIVFFAVTAFLFQQLYKYLKQGIGGGRSTRYILTIGAWLAFTGVLGATGFLQKFDTIPPRLVIIFIPMILFLLYVAFSKRGRDYADAFPLAAITYLQVFRIVVEFGLWKMHKEGVIPVQMTWEGRNIDVLVGLTAPIMGYLYFNKKVISKYILLAWNIAGMIILTNIVVIVVVSTPTFFRVFMNDPANTIIAYFPFVWLPAFLVPAAYLMHILSLRKILQGKE